MQADISQNSFPKGGRFEPVSLLGRGSMGVVWRVRDLETESEVALKTLATSTPEELYRLKNEFRVLADLVHGNLVELYELFLEDQTPCFTMEFIDGAPFVGELRRDPDKLLERLAGAAGQLTDALQELHRARRLHRDIKPSNVLVSRRSERVVLLDFGLATILGDDRAPHYGNTVTGTWAYMAPEIQQGMAPTPAADWYSVGAMLFETFTGETPLPAVMRGWHPLRDQPRIAEGLPADWREALESLLEVDPARRARGVELLAAIGGRTGSSHAAASTARVFVGRENEQAQLASAFHDVADGGRIVEIVGQSGIGKSELVRRFIDDLAVSAAPPLLIAGRSHPQEALPYKAFDPLIDRLTRVLLDDPERARHCVPDDTQSLRRLFPVLGRVPAFAEDSGERGGFEPVDLRRRAFAALRHLLARLAESGPLVLWLDDLQWSDEDSLLLLREILRPPMPRMLLVLSYRSEDLLPERLAERCPLPPERTSRIGLGPLSESEGTALLRSLSLVSGDAPLRIPQALHEAAGNPFLLGELARSQGMGDRGQYVGDMIAQRLTGLSTVARNLLETICVAGGPLARSDVLDAVGIGERGRPLARDLEKRSLLRTTTVDGDVGVEIYHDRIRETLLDMLPADLRRARHESLAEMLLRRPDPDPEGLYRHTLGAGRRDEAATWAERAAERAASTLAFLRAADLFGQAMELLPESAPRWQLLEKRAAALGNAGHGLEAARLYQAASDELDHADGKQHGRVLGLRERAANHLLQSGHFDEGIRVTTEVLRQVGVAFPGTQGRALLSSLWQRGRLALRGLGFTPRDGELDESSRLRLEACWNASTSLTMVDQALADALGVRHVREALDSGDPVHAIRAFGGEASRTAQLAGAFMRRRCVKLADAMDALVRQHGGPFERAHVRSVRGMIAFQSSHWRSASGHFDASEKILQHECVGRTWEMATIRLFGLSALAHMGRLRELAERLPGAIGNAADRGDLYASLLFHTGVMNLVWLARDEADEASRVADDAISRWPASRQFTVEEYVHLIATVHAALYRGDPWNALQRMEAAWPRLRAALFLAFESARVELRNMRARAALAAAVAPSLAADATPPDPRWPRERLLAIVRREAARLARIDSVVSAPAFAALLGAGLLAADGRSDEAAQAYLAAERALGSIEMDLYAAAAAYRAAALLGGESGRLLRDAAQGWAEREDVRNAERMFAVMAPA